MLVWAQGNQTESHGVRDTGIYNITLIPFQAQCVAHQDKVGWAYVIPLASLLGLYLYLKQVCFHGYIFNVADPIFPKFLKQGCFQAISTLLLIQFKKTNFSGSCIRWINGFNLFFLVTNLLVYSYLCTGYHSLLLGTVSWVRDVAHGPLIFEYLPVIKVYI